MNSVIKIHGINNVKTLIMFFFGGGLTFYIDVYTVTPCD